MLAVLASVKDRQATIRRALDLAIEQLIILAGLRGLAEGKAEGELTVLRALLSKRFGELPTWAQERIERAPVEQLENWSLKLLDSASLDEVLGGN